jgi:hypothetical protein
MYLGTLLNDCIIQPLFISCSQRCTDIVVKFGQEHEFISGGIVCSVGHSQLRAEA